LQEGHPHEVAYLLLYERRKETKWHEALVETSRSGIRSLHEEERARCGCFRDGHIAQSSVGNFFGNFLMQSRTSSLRFHWHLQEKGGV
jgi:hypothetical protein